jgi:mannosyl-oligosaccharide alpha-1,3-glucosidase
MGIYYYTTPHHIILHHKPPFCIDFLVIFGYFWLMTALCFCRYSIHTEATEKGLYIKNKDGKDFDGWCWPGQSSYLDFTDPRVRAWWADRFSLEKYEGSTMDLFTWNDMNEPSVFNGPEVSMQKDCKNLQDVEHRYWHNMYGLYMQRATAEGLTLRDKPTQSLRPFVLSRAFWAGSQKYGAIWTGDNSATWGHLKIAAPMLLSIGLAGLPFCGADVGGFFGEPGAELFTRWYQAGAFTPFFRGHAHHDTKRREPWMYGDEHTKIHRQVAMIRYSLLPFWYTTFYTSYRTGIPVMRPMFSEFPDNEVMFTMDDQWMVGSSLLVKPVTEAGKSSADVYLPGGDSHEDFGWYDFYSLKRLQVRPGGGLVTVPAPLSTIPVFIKGGSIVPRKMRLRRSSKLMAFDPYTLVVAPHVATGSAYGQLYLDDESTLAHERQAAYAVRDFTMETKLDGQVSIKCTNGVKGPAPNDNGQPFFEVTNVVERIVIAGQKRPPTSVTMGITEIQFVYDAASQVLTLKKPSGVVTKDWEIVMKYA